MIKGKKLTSVAKTSPAGSLLSSLFNPLLTDGEYGVIIYNCFASILSVLSFHLDLCLPWFSSIVIVISSHLFSNPGLQEGFGLVNLYLKAV